jgi:hypothetical protein
MILTLPPGHTRRFLGVEFRLAVASIRTYDCLRASIKPRKNLRGKKLGKSVSFAASVLRVFINAVLINAPAAALEISRI